MLHPYYGCDGDGCLSLPVLNLVSFITIAHSFILRFLRNFFFPWYQCLRQVANNSQVFGHFDRLQDRYLIGPGSGRAQSLFSKFILYVCAYTFRPLCIFPSRSLNSVCRIICRATKHTRSESPLENCVRSSASGSRSTDPKMVPFTYQDGAANLIADET